MSGGIRVTAEDFRALALRLPEAAERAHMGHPDFRVRDKIFATLGPDATWGMVKLTPDQQAGFMREEPGVFQPCSGAWGRQGATEVRLAAAREPSVRRALRGVDVVGAQRLPHPAEVAVKAAACGQRERKHGGDRSTTPPNYQ